MTQHANKRVPLKRTWHCHAGFSASASPFFLRFMCVHLIGNQWQKWNHRTTLRSRCASRFSSGKKMKIIILHRNIFSFRVGGSEGESLQEKREGKFPRNKVESEGDKSTVVTRVLHLFHFSGLYFPFLLFFFALRFHGDVSRNPFEMQSLWSRLIS